MEDHLISFCSDDCVGPLKIDGGDYYSIKFNFIRKSSPNYNDRYLYFRLDDFESFVPMEFFTYTIEASIQCMESILKQMLEETSAFYMHQSIISSVLGKLLYTEVSKVIDDDQVDILQLEFIFDYYFLDELIRVDYKIKCLKAFVWQNENKNTQDSINHHCVICLCDFLPEENVAAIIPCGHVFHEDCLKKWFHVNFKCPICRIYPSTLKDL